MANCSSCGSSSACGCPNGSLATNCVDNYNIGCSPLCNECSEIYCMECVQPCVKENKWSVTTTTGILFEVANNESLTQVFQKFLLSQTTDINTFNTALIPYFAIANINTSMIQFMWNYTGTASNTGFYIKWRLESDTDFLNGLNISGSNTTSLNFNIVGNNLTSGLTYVFRIQTINAGVAIEEQQSVELTVTIP